MRPTELLYFIPFVAAAFWLGYLIFRKDLAARSLGGILSYFVGIFIIFIAVGWMIDYFLVSWANDRLQNAQNSVELQQFINTSEQIIQRSFSEPNTVRNVVITPAVVEVVVTATPGARPATPLIPGANQAGPNQMTPYTVVSGDTLSSISQRFGIAIDNIMAANNITNPHLILPGQTLLIPTSGN